MSSRIIVGVTGASGAIYARQVICALLSSPAVTEVAVVVSDNGRDVMAFEGESIDLADLRITLYDNSDMFAPVASGSSGFDAMIIVPCSVGTMGRIASGVSSDLISRAADVMLKERRRLVLVVRESPLSTIHLRNMTSLSECGAVIVPACPSFYSLPEGIESLCQSVTERAVVQSGVDIEHFSWGK